MGEGSEGGNRVRVDHQRELQLVESCFQSRVGRDHCSGGVATREGVVTELLACDAASLEHHLVLGQRARLVAEHVLHLPELLGDVERPALDSLLMHLVPHQGVVVDQVNLGNLGQLNRHIEGKGDDDLENDDESPEIQMFCNLEPSWDFLLLQIRLTIQILQRFLALMQLVESNDISHA